MGNLVDQQSRALSGLGGGKEADAPFEGSVPGLRELLRSGAGVHPSAPSAFVAEVSLQMKAEKQAMAVEILEAIQSEIPEYGAITDPLRIAELLVSCEVMISVFARIVRSEPGLSAEEWEFVKQIGRRRAEQGFPLSAVVSAFHVGMNVGWEYMARRVHVGQYSPDDANTLMAIALQLLHFIADITRAISDAYLASGPWRSLTRERASQVLVADFLSGAFLAEEDLGARAARFRSDLSTAHAIVLIAGRTADNPPPGSGHPGHIEGPWVDAGEGLIQRVPDALPIAVVATPVPHAAVLVPAVSPSRWRELVALCEELRVKHGVTILAVPPVAGAVPIYQSYIDARDSLALARKVLQGQERVASVDDLRIYRLLQGRAEDRRMFVRNTLGPVLELKESRRRSLLDALEAWYAAEGNVDEAARKLFVHPNTLRYRLRRLEELTGLALRTPSHQVRLDLALHLLRLDDAPES